LASTSSGALAAVGAGLFLLAVALLNRFRDTLTVVLVAAALAAVAAAVVFRRNWGMAAFAPLGAAAGGFVVWAFAAPSFASLRRDGDVMVADVEQYRQANGRYPETLAEAGVTPPWSRFGPWRYESDGASFRLAIGEYGRDGFVLSFISGGRGWYTDT
jgi:hypothetical protein